jgi:catechol 2,3-dioxygenase-like lactoylglutathione lyase family enzyme
MLSTALPRSHEELAMTTRSPAVTVFAFDHLVLRCADVETTLRWYIDELGLEPVRLDEWRQGTAPFPSLRIDPHTIIDLVPGRQADGRLDHICLVVEPTDLEALATSGRFEVLDGPGPRYGARGNGTSIYIRDPDGTTVELRHY